MKNILKKIASYLWDQFTLAVRLLVVAFSFCDNLASNIVQLIFPPRWKIEGKCKRCGECCYLIGLSTPNRLAKRPWIKKTLIWWQENINRFKFEDVVEEKETDLSWFLYSCNRITTEGLCGDYRHRPRICREYPQLPQYKMPDIVHNCGFKAAPRKKD